MSIQWVPIVGPIIIGPHNYAQSSARVMYRQWATGTSLGARFTAGVESVATRVPNLIAFEFEPLTMLDISPEYEERKKRFLPNGKLVTSYCRGKW